MNRTRRSGAVGIWAGNCEQAKRSEPIGVYGQGGAEQSLPIDGRLDFKRVSGLKFGAKELRPKMATLALEGFYLLRPAIVA